MVVKKTMVDVSRGVICTWRVVCGERGRGMESCWGWRVGDAEIAAAAVGFGGDCVEGADMKRGILYVRFYVIKSHTYIDPKWLKTCRRKSSTVSPTSIFLALYMVTLCGSGW